MMLARGLRLTWGRRSHRGLFPGGWQRRGRPDAWRAQRCMAAKVKAPPNNEAVEQEPHKYFDQAVLHVKGGRGGKGERSENRKPKKVPNFKYKAGRNQPKFKELPPAEPADGGDGGDVVLYVDTGHDDLLHLHSTRAFKAKDGPSGAATPNNRVGRPRYRKAPRGEALRLPVPPGTLVRRRRNKQVLADLISPGQEVTVARGGTGGLGLARAREASRPKRAPRKGKGEKSGIEEESVIEVDSHDATMDMTRGNEGEELAIELLMRTVADISLVGLPNAGKSSLLSRCTRASPGVQLYPFTTLTPNLGVARGGEGKGHAIFADLPGLIEGAHRGRGLGREFLRHARRARALILVVDAAAGQVQQDLRCLREELRMYNPDYVRRPYVVALNKIDLLEGSAEAAREEAMSALEGHSDVFGAPSSVLCVSAETGENVGALIDAATNAVEELAEGRDGPSYASLQQWQQVANEAL